MASNSFGTLFRITTWGESHGKALGVVIDGCPAGVALDDAYINEALARRAPGQSPYTSPREEKDTATILSGVFEGLSTGTPISIMIENKDADSSKYADIAKLMRPGHANFTYLQKYGAFDYRGGGRASARETAARVAAGAVAQKFLETKNISVIAYLSAVGSAQAYAENSARTTPSTAQSTAPSTAQSTAPSSAQSTAPSTAQSTAPNPEKPSQKINNSKGTVQFLSPATNALLLQPHIAQSTLFAPTPQAEQDFAHEILAAKANKDSVGGVVTFYISGVSVGLGDPIYEKISAKLGYAMLSIPATKGFELGEGFASASMRGSLHNDTFCSKQNTIVCASNTAGGTLGGITTGEPIFGRVAFKPTSSIEKPQPTVDIHAQDAEFVLPQGSRHDPCVAVRAVPVVEAMCWIVLADAWLMQRSIEYFFLNNI